MGTGKNSAEWVNNIRNFVYKLKYLRLNLPSTPSLQHD